MKNRIVHTFLQTYFANVAILLLSIFTGVLLARLLMPEGRGALAAILYWPHLIAGFCCLSINEAITYRICQPHVNMDKISSTAFWMSIGMGLILIIIFYPLIPLAMGDKRADISHLSQLYSLFFFPSTILIMNLLSLDQGKLNFARFNVLRILQPLSYLLAIIYVWVFFEVTVKTVVVATLFSVIFTAFLRLSIVKNIFNHLPSFEETKKSLAIGLKFHFTNMSMFLGNEIDKLMIIMLSDNTKLGYYMVAFTVSSTGIGTIIQTFTSIIFPHIAQRSRGDDQNTLIIKSLKYASIIMILCNGLLIICIPVLLPILFGSAYQPSIILSIILLISNVFKGMRKIMVYCLRGAGKSRESTVSELFAVGVFIALSFPMFRHYDITGICLALAIGNIFGMISMEIYFRKTMSIKIEHWLGFNRSELKELLQFTKSMILRQNNI